MTAHMVPQQEKVYRSPRHKLVKFFENSRNQWKTKCLDAKATLRQVKNRAHWLAQSRDSWKRRSCELTHRVRELEAETRRQRDEIAALKKSPLPSPPPPKPS